MVSTCNISLDQLRAPVLDTDALRQAFPIFAANPDLMYLDSAATSQKPQLVLETIEQYFAKNCANAGRASYSWSSQLQNAIESTRQKVASFINCQPKNLAFTSGATESLNTVAMAWGLFNLADGDEIMLCPKDHKSAILPWYNLQKILAAQGKQISIKHFGIHEVGDYELKEIKAGLSPKTKLIALTHVHHVFGLDMEIPEIREIVGPDVLISLDASQSIGHEPIDVVGLTCDFMSFSGHKMFAAPGVGGLYAHDRVKDTMHPIKLGGKSPVSVSGGLKVEAKNLGELLEVGTQNIPAILSLGSAVDFINEIGQQNIQKHVSNLTVYLWQKMKDLPGVYFAPGIGVCGCEEGFGILAFRLEQVASSDLAFTLDAEDIFVRSGDHCAYLQDKGKEDAAEAQDDYIRVSMHAYNTFDEIDQFVQVLECVIKN